MHRLHPHEAVRDDVVGQDHMVGMQVDALGGVLDVIAQDAREVAGLGGGHDDAGALLPVVSVACVPGRLAEEGALRRILLRPDAELMLLLHLLGRPEHLLDDRIPFDERPLAGGYLDARPVRAVKSVAPFQAVGAVVDGDPHVVTDQAARDPGEATFAKGQGAGGRLVVEDADLVDAEVGAADGQQSGLTGHRLARGAGERHVAQEYVLQSLDLDDRFVRVALDDAARAAEAGAIATEDQFARDRVVAGGQREHLARMGVEGSLQVGVVGDVDGPGREGRQQAGGEGGEAHRGMPRTSPALSGC